MVDVICSFCGRDFKGRGKMVVHKKGDVTFLCSSKCEKSWDKKRNPRRVRWTLIAQKAKAETKAETKKADA